MGSVASSGSMVLRTAVTFGSGCLLATYLVTGCAPEDTGPAGSTGGTTATGGTPAAGGTSAGGSSTGGKATGGSSTGGKATGGSGGVAGNCPEGNTLLCGMVAAHNAARAAVNPVPSTPLPAMTWDATVAAAAQSWADQCNFSHNTGGYGQNLYASSARSASAAPTPQSVVDSWVSEAANYTYATNSCSGTCGHYTQVVWRNSTLLGCGMTYCTTGSPFSGFSTWYNVVCDYSPPGNYVGQKPY
jgi:pathogenesis-related protein 1